MNELRLCIGIPTWNRAHTLDQLLQDCLDLSKRLNLVSVVVCDNASIDGSGQICQKFAEAGLNLSYNRNEKNIGFDHNFIKTCEHAEGDYLWVIGSDDRINCDAVVDIINYLKSNDKRPEIITFDIQKFRTDDVHYFSVHRFADSGVVLEGGGVGCAKVIGGGLGLLSQCIIKRDILTKRLLDEAKSNYSDGFSHFFIRLKLLPGLNQWIHAPFLPLRYREFDVLGQTLSPIDRVLFDVHASFKIYMNIYLDDPVLSKQIYYSVERELMGRFLQAISGGGVTFGKRLHVIRMIYRLSPSFFKIRFIPLYLIILLPSAAAKSLRSWWRKLKQWSFIFSNE